jgi:hypothetical protein
MRGPKSRALRRAALHAVVPAARLDPNDGSAPIATNAPVASLSKFPALAAIMRLLNRKYLGAHVQS